VPADVLTMPAELQRQVVDYRNTRVEHAEDPRLRFATTWGPDHKARIYPMVLFPREGEAESLQNPTGDIEGLLILVGRYISAMLDFFDANADKSILPPLESR